MKVRSCYLRLLAMIMLAPCAHAGESEFSSLSHRRAMFRVRQDVRIAERALAWMELLPWQRESIQLLLDEQSRAAEVFRLGSDLQGRDFENKIGELIEVTHYKIGLALPASQRAEWSQLVARRGLSFTTRRILATGTPDPSPEP